MEITQSVKLVAIENFIEEVINSEERIINNIIEHGALNEGSVRILEKITYFFFMARLLESIINKFSEEELLHADRPVINGFYDMIIDCYPEFTELMKKHSKASFNNLDGNDNYGLLH